MVTGARVVGPVRITFRVRQFPLPSGLSAVSHASAVWLAFYDTSMHRWQPVASTYDPATRTVTAQVRHLSWWAPWTWDWQGFALRLRQSLSAIGSGRAPAASCAGVPKVTVTSAGGQDPPLIGCVAKRGPDMLTVSITNNRGVSMVMSGVPPDATQDPPSYQGFDEYIATRSATTHVLGAADLAPSETLTYALPLHGPPTAFTAGPTLRSYALDLASIVGEALVGVAEFGKVSGDYATCVLNAVAGSAPASFADIPRVAGKCLPALAKAVPALKGLSGPVIKLLQVDATVILQDYDLVHDTIRSVSGEVTIIRPAVVLLATPDLYVHTAFTFGLYKYPSFPSMIGLDNHDWISGLHWDLTGPATAQATGILHYDQCTPSCAGGTYMTYAIQIVTSSPQRCQVVLRLGDSQTASAYVFNNIQIAAVNDQPPSFLLGSRPLSPACGGGFT